MLAYISKTIWSSASFCAIALCSVLPFELLNSASALADTLPFYERSVVESTSSAVVFPSNDYKVCRNDAAADLSKIFFCTKREWLRASTLLLSSANQLSSEVEERKQVIFSLRGRLAGLIPDYLLFSTTLAMDDISKDQIQISYEIIDNASRTRDIVEGLYYDTSTPFNWREFDRTERVLREAIENYEGIYVRLNARLDAIDRIANSFDRLTSPKSIHISLAPRNGFTHRALHVVSMAEGSLSINVNDFVRLESVNVWSGFDLTISASAPVNLQIWLAFGQQPSVEYFQVNFDTSVSSKFTPFTRSQARALEAHQALNFTAMPEDILRFLNSGRWDGTVKVWLAEPMTNEDIRQIGFRFRYFE